MSTPSANVMPGSSPSICDADGLRALLGPAAVSGQQPGNLSDRAASQRFLVIPLPEGTASSRDAIGNTPAGLECDVERLLVELTGQSSQHHEVDVLESERDALADEVGQTFEELRCLRRLATDLSACDVTHDHFSIVDDFLPTLRDVISAQAVVLVAKQTPKQISGPGDISRSDQVPIIRTGDGRISQAEILDLRRQFDHLSSTDPIVFNRGSDLQRHTLETTAHCLIAVPVAHQQSSYGWLIAIDRGRVSGRLSEHNAAEFGSREVGLLTTAATMLAGHARNIELFRAEERLRLGVIEAITGALDARDPYTCGHSRRVAQFAVQIARQLAWPPDECERLYVTGLLHDVGKIGVPDDILRKPSELTAEEFDVVKQHPTIGHAILSPLHALSYVLPGVLHHHERIDGRGYPHGLKGDAIPLDARILAVADSYDAMTSDRAYRPGMPHPRAIEILRSGAGDQWDSDIVQAFLTTAVASGD